MAKVKVWQTSLTMDVMVLWCRLKWGGLVGTSEWHFRVVGRGVEYGMPALGERGPGDQGVSVPLATPFEVEVVFTAWSKPNEEARPESLGIGGELPPHRDKVSLEVSRAGGVLGVEGQPKSAQR